MPDAGGAVESGGAGATVTSPKKQPPPQQNKGKTVQTSVLLLDGSLLDVYVERRAKGEEVLDAVCQSLNLVEKDYFGLIYEDKLTGNTNWLELDKRVVKFIKGEPWRLTFEVKFYPPDPSQLQEDITRYHLCLQIRNDILSGKLPCSFVTYALLGSYLVQSELGDYDSTEHRDTSYLREFRFAPDQSPELEQKVVELHKTHKGQTPAEAELHYLENAKKLTLYGVDLHPAKDSEGVDIMIGICSSGLMVFRDRLKINRFAWPKILKISYKRNNFYVKIRPGDYEQYESTIGFKLGSHRSAKKLWKTCVEYHTFFRLTSPEPALRTGIMPKLSSKFRYSGRTHYESKRQTIDRQQPQFTRSHSTKKFASLSMEPIGARKSPEGVNETGSKRHTMPIPPDHIPGVDDSPAKKRLRDKIGANSSVSSVSSTEGEYEPPSQPEDLEKPVGGVAVLPVINKNNAKEKEPVKTHDTNGVANDRGEVFIEAEKENRETINRESVNKAFIDREIGTKKEGDGQKEDLEQTPGSPDRLSKLKSPASGFFSWGKSTREKKKEKDKKGKKEAIAIELEETKHEEEKTKKSSWGRKREDSKEKEEDKNKENENKDKEGLKEGDKEGGGGGMSVFKEFGKKKDSKGKSKDKEGEEKDTKSKGKDKGKDKNKDNKDKDKDSKSKDKDSKSKDKDAKSKDKDPKGKDKDSKSKDKDTKGKEKDSKGKDKDSKGKDKDSKGKDKGKDKNKEFKEQEALATSGTGDSGKEESLVSDKDRSMESTLIEGAATGTPGYTKTYDYVVDDVEEEKRKKLVGAFSYEGKTVEESGGDKPVSPGRRQTGLAFNYAPGEGKKVADAVEKRKEKPSTTQYIASSPNVTNKSNLSSTQDQSLNVTSSPISSGGSPPTVPTKTTQILNVTTPLKSSESPSQSRGPSMYTSSFVTDESLLSESGSYSMDDSRLQSPMSSFGKTSESTFSKPSFDDGVHNSSYPYGGDPSAKFIEAESVISKGPKIVKTTTKQSVVKEGGELTQNIEEKIEDLNSKEVWINTHVNKAEGLDDSGSSPYVTATSVTTRTATTHEDLGTNVKTGQVEEKTVARSTTTSATRQEQRVVTQEVRATTSTVLNDKQLMGRRSSSSSESSDDSGTPIDGDGDTYFVNNSFQEPIVETESVLYKAVEGNEAVQSTMNVPLVATQVMEAGSYTTKAEIISSQTITSKTRTVETTTYKTEKDGQVETRVEQKITIQSDGDPIDHDKALAEAIQEAAAMNPNMTVEKIEIQQQ